MCTSGGRSARSSQLGAERRQVSTSYRTSGFRSGARSGALSMSIRPPKEILDRAYANKQKSTGGGIYGQNPMNSFANRQAYGSDTEGMGSMRGKGVSKMGRYSVNDAGDIFMRGKSGTNYKASHSASMYGGGGWKIGTGALSGQLDNKSGGYKGGMRLRDEAHAKSVYSDFGQNFMQKRDGSFYKGTTKRNPLARQRVKDESKMRIKTRGARSNLSNSAGNAARKAKKGGNLRISRAGTQTTGGGSGINIGR